LIVWLIATFFLGSNVEVAFQNVMNVAGFHHKILVGQTAWPRYFSDERPIYFTTSGSSQKKSGINSKKIGGKISKCDECCWFSSQNLGWPDCMDTIFF
jgi:hypothetical protein